LPDNENGKMYHDNGKMKFKGQIVQGKKHGKGEVYHPNEVIMYKGRFLDDKIEDADCSIYHDNYELKYRGMMKKGKMHGDGVKIYTKTGKIQFFGKVIEGAFIYGKIYHPNANIKYDGVL
jgi:antitoxin component YwqK of YwqJK toxin-antitoxin module